MTKRSKGNVADEGKATEKRVHGEVDGTVDGTQTPRGGEVDGLQSPSPVSDPGQMEKEGRAR
jgi:hypothetical protein